MRTLRLHDSRLLSAGGTRFFRGAWPTLNRVQVGGSTSVSHVAEDGAPTLQVEFGSVKSRERRRAERLTRNKEVMERLNDLQKAVTAPTEDEEEAARSVLLNSYGFSSLPPTCYFHRQFLSELRRYELSWQSTNHIRTVLGFKIIDHGIDGKGDSPVVLCNLRGDNDKSTCFSDFHQGVNKLLFETNATTYSIPFHDEFGLGFEVQLTSVFPLVAGSGAQSTARAVAEDVDELSYADRVRREVEEALTQPFVASPGGPFRRYTQRVNVSLLNCQSGVVKPILQDISIQAFGFAYITGVSRFMRATDQPGTNRTNREIFFTKSDYEYLRYNFVTFRQQLGMRPIDNMELNMMLPPF